MSAIYKPPSNYSIRAIFGCHLSSNITHIMARARSHFNLWNYWNGMPLLKFIKCGMRCHRYHCCRLLYQNEIFKWIKQQKIVAATAAAVKFTPFWFFNKISLFGVKRRAFDTWHALIIAPIKLSNYSKVKHLSDERNAENRDFTRVATKKMDITTYINIQHWQNRSKPNKMRMTGLNRSGFCCIPFNLSRSHSDLTPNEFVCTKFAVQLFEFSALFQSKSPSSSMNFHNQYLNDLIETCTAGTEFNKILSNENFHLFFLCLHEMQIKFANIYRLIPHKRSKKHMKIEIRQNRMDGKFITLKKYVKKLISRWARTASEILYSFVETHSFVHGVLFSRIISFTKYFNTRIWFAFDS